MRTRQILNFNARHLAAIVDVKRTMDILLFIIFIYYYDYYVCILTILPCRNVSGNPVDVGGPHDSGRVLYGEPRIFTKYKYLFSRINLVAII